MRNCIAIAALLSLPLLTACETVDDGQAIVLASLPRTSQGLPSLNLSFPPGVPGVELVGHGPPIRVLQPRQSCGSGRVHTVAREEYVLRVMMCEAVWSWSGNSLATQAIAIRSFADHYRCQGGAGAIAQCADVYGDDRNQVMAIPVGATQTSRGVVMAFQCTPFNRDPYIQEIHSANASQWNRVVTAVKDTLGLVVVNQGNVTMTQYSNWDLVDKPEYRHPLNQARLYGNVGNPESFVSGLYGGSVRQVGSDVRCAPAIPDDMLVAHHSPPINPVTQDDTPVTLDPGYDADYGSPDDGRDWQDSYPDNDHSVVAWGDSEADNVTPEDNTLLAGGDGAGTVMASVTPTQAALSAAAAAPPADAQAAEAAWNAAAASWYREARAGGAYNNGTYGTMESSYHYGGGSPWGAGLGSLFPVSYEGDNGAAAAASCYPCNLETVPKGCSPIGCSETVGGTCNPVGCVPVDTPDDDDSGACVPEPEQCNGKDDDCDGTADNGSSMGVGITCSAQSAQGQCAVGQMLCEAGALKCQPGSPAAETCDGLDNDCDGQVDNVPGGCSGEPTADTSEKAEVCNGKDDNGDGFPDEDNPGGGGKCNLPPAGGQIVEGTLACVGGRLECITVAVPNAEAQGSGTGGTSPVQSNEVEAAAWACSTAPGRSPAAPPVALLLVLLGLTLVRRSRR